MQLDAGAARDEAIGQGRGDAAQKKRFFAVLPPAADDVVALGEFFENAPDIARVILQVGIDGHHDLAPRRVEAGRHRRRLPEIAPKVNDMPAPVARLHRVQAFIAAVMAAVIDSDDFVIALDLLQRGGQFLMQALYIALFVVDGDDDGQRQFWTCYRFRRDAHTQAPRA